MVDEVFSGFCDQLFTGNKDCRPVHPALWMRRQDQEFKASLGLIELDQPGLHDTLSPKKMLSVGLALHGLQILIWKGWRLPVTLGTVWSNGRLTYLRPESSRLGLGISL